MPTDDKKPLPDLYFAGVIRVLHRTPPSIIFGLVPAALATT